MIFPLQEYWSQLREGTRDQIIGGLIVAIVLGLAAIFWKSIVRGLRRLLSIGDPNPAPQPVVVKVEAVHPAPPVQAAPSSTDRPVIKSQIPRPPLAGFVARRDESGREIVERLKEELSPQKEQLIVLWGAGGVGKTTLAAETGRAMRDVFHGGIVWTSADGKPDYSLSTLLDAIATHLGRPDLRQLVLEHKDEEVHDAVSKAPDTLIVLDNFETISPEHQKQCAEWLAKRASCPALITSRDEVAHARPVRISAMSLSEAREFLRRLISEAHNQSAFKTLDQEEIIKAADRIPLVLQWVVKQIDSAKQPRVVLDELLHGGGEAAQRVFDRSFDLPQVGDDGRAVLLALSLFVPSASRVALAEVAGFGNERERLDHAVQQLAELWLIQTTDGNERLKVEGLTRELTKVCLEKNGDAETYRQRFVAYFRNYVEAHAEQIPENYNTLETEKDNILNAVEMAFELVDWESVKAIAKIIAVPVGGVLNVRGYWTDELKANQQALVAARHSDSQHDIAEFAHNLAITHSDRGELQEARQLYNESLEIVRKLDHQQGISSSLHQLAWLAHQQREFEEARRLYNESLEMERKLENQDGIASSLHHLAILAHDQRQFVEARELYNESLKIKRTHGNVAATATTLYQLGKLAHEQNELAEARELYNESLEIFKNSQEQHGIASCLHVLALLAEGEGDLKEAARLYGEALTIFERLTSPNADISRRGLERVQDKVSK